SHQAQPGIKDTRIAPRMSKSRLPGQLMMKLPPLLSPSACDSALSSSQCCTFERDVPPRLDQSQTFAVLHWRILRPAYKIPLPAQQRSDNLSYLPTKFVSQSEDTCTIACLQVGVAAPPETTVNYPNRGSCGLGRKL